MRASNKRGSWARRTSNLAIAACVAFVPAASFADSHIQELIARGLIDQSVGRHRSAVVHLESAMAEAERAGNTANQLRAGAALGAALTWTRQFDRAEAILIESLALAEKTGDETAKVQLLNNLANAYAAAEKYDDAQQMYDQCIALAQRRADKVAHARALTNAATSAALAGRSDAAGLARSALERLLMTADSRDKAFGLLTVARTFERLQEEQPNNTSFAASVLSARTNALSAAKRANDPLAEAYALSDLSESYTGADALAMVRRAAFLAQQEQSPLVLYRAQWQIGKLLDAGGDREAAIASYRAAIATFREIQADTISGNSNRLGITTFRRSIAPMYYELADLLLRHADAANDPAEKQQRLLDAREAIEALKAAEMADYYGDECFDLDEASRRAIDQLEPGSAVVYIVALHDRTELLLTLPSGLRQYKIDVNNDRLYSVVDRFRQRLETRTSHRYLTEARQLYQWLLTPIEADLAAEGVHTLVFVPDGALRTVPMGALNDGEKFLIEKYAVAVTPGLTLMDPKRLERGRVRVLACGLSESVQGFAALEYVSTEIANIYDLYGGRQLVNQRFLVPAVTDSMRGDPVSVVHVASHGQFSADPDKTFLLTFEGQLTLDALELLIRPSQFRGEPVELLALSACQTAAGDDRAALGLAGVAIKAGARSALATLWFVNDEASATLVTRFYAELRDDPTLSKGQALQRAQQAILADPRYRHPSYWAPYLLIGNWL